MWFAWIIMAGIAACVSRRHNPWPAVAILAGVVAMRAAVLIPPNMQLLAFAALWVGIGGLIIHKLHSPLTGGLIVASGLCYGWARLVGVAPAIGELPFVAADFLGVVALIVAAIGERNRGSVNRHHTGDTRGGGWVLGSVDNRRVRSAGDCLEGLGGQKGRG